MNPENRNPGIGRVIAGCLLGILFAIASPLTLLTEVLSLSPMLLLPAAAMIWLYRWAGRVPAMFMAVMQLVFTSMMLEGTFVWMAFFMTIMPAFILVHMAQRPFFEQMKISLAVFGCGIVIAVVILYLSFGGNMIERTLMQLPEAMRAVPLEALEVPMANFGEMLGRELTPESFYTLFDDIITNLIPAYQLHMPALIFTGALISAVFCVWLSNYMLKRRNISAEGAYRPLRDWALPPSATGGLLLITVISYAAYAGGMRQGQTLYYAVYNIAVTAFCIQAIGSVARRLNHPQVAPRTRVGITVGLVVLWLLGGVLYIAIYGCASAIFGTHGALAAYRNSNSNNNHHSDDEYRR